MQRQRSGTRSVTSPQRQKKWFRRRLIQASRCSGICRQVPGRRSTRPRAWLRSDRAQAAEAIQGVAAEVGNKVAQAATTAYQQGARAGGYVSQYTAEQPLTALLIAGAIGYGLAYLIHRNTEN